MNYSIQFNTAKSLRVFAILVACAAMPCAHIFAQTYPTLPALPPAEPSTHINVTSSPYNASTSASTAANATAFQKAITAASGTPGGAVVDVPAGTYNIGSINLLSNTWLNVESGATLKASESTSDYPVVIERWQGQDINCYRGLISAYGMASAPLTNVAIIGSGTIIGPSGGINNSRNSSSSPNTPIGPDTIEPRYCNGVYIQGITSEAFAIWNIHPTYCSDVTVSGVTTSGSSANSDGCDPDSCARVLIEGCTFGSGDDDIAVKSGRGIDGATVNIPASDTTIENCTFLNCGGSSGGVSFGSEISGGVERVDIENCTFKFTGANQKAIYIKYAHGRGGFVNDVIADTNTTACELLDIESNYSNQQYGYNGNGPLGGETVPAPASGMVGISQVNNIYILNSTETGGTAVSVLGDPQKPVDNLVINGITGSNTTAGSITNATNVTLTGIAVGTVSKTNVITGITINTDSVTVAPGGAAVYAVSVPAGLPSGAVSLSIVGTGVGNQLPSGTTASFNPSTLSSGSGSSTLTLATSGSSPAGTYSENIQAMDSAGTLAWTAAVTLVISGTPPPPQVAAPAFSVAGGTYTSAQTVTITSSTGGASIRYTTDGSTPSETAGTLYSSPVSISATATLQAIAYESGMTDSSITSATYTINSGSGGTLSFEAESIAYTATGATASVQTDVNSSGGKWIELAATGTGQYIDYTVTNVPAGTYSVQMEWKGNTSRGTLQLAVDGTNLGSTLDQYSATQVYPTTTFGNVTFSSTGSHDIRLTVTTKNGSSSQYYLSSDVFFLVPQSGGNPAAAPAFSVAGGTYTSAQTVTITSSTGGASIRYTTDGSTPSETAGTLYSSPVSISVTTTLQAIAYASGYSDSSVTSATYTISLPAAAAPAFSLAGGTYTSAQTVTITSSTGGANIRYTTDGSTPSETAGTLYSSPVTISATATLKAIAYASGYSDSSVTSATYTIGSAPTLNFEAESISYTATGATASVQTDTNSSGGKWIELAATGSTGQYIDYTVTSVPAGTYTVEMEWKGNTSRGTLQLSVDGTNLGSTLDQYSATQVYPTTTFGTVTFTTTGNHDIRLTVTGKNGSSSNYYLSSDKFTLVGQ